jgi:hypothetical protein
MSANQRRSGFRLPWASESEESGESLTPSEAAATVPSSEPSAGEPAGEDVTAAAATSSNGTTGPDAAEPKAAAPTSEAAAAPSAAPADAPAPAPAPAAQEPPSEFLRELIVAMRKVADDARTTGVEKLKAEAEEAIRSFEADAEKRRQDLRERAEADVTGVGEWSRAEAERIQSEAEQRVAARRAQLEQQLAAEGTRTEAEAKAMRGRVDDYERELEAYYAQLTEINDPAAFAAAAKRMPAAPDLTPGAVQPATAAAEAPAPSDATATPPSPAEAGETASPPSAGSEASAVPDVHPAEEEVLAARLAELDEKLKAAPTTEGPAQDSAAVATEIVVKGLGSFGAITGFRQSLSAQPGIDGVALSLGQSGEFVFRATHAPGFDVGAAITAMEGDGATVESRPEGGLRVTLERSR